MTDNVLDLLVDVVALSAQRCSSPILGDLRYGTQYNVAGRPIDGYSTEALDVCLLTKPVAGKLCQVQQELIDEHGMGLLIHDSYRPRRAVLDLFAWAQQPPANEYELERKQKHYPHLDKQQIFTLGYFAEDSRHSLGSTVDAVLIDMDSKQLLDMGVRFDYLGELGHTDATAEQIGAEAVKNREILGAAMVKHDFEPYYKEYWHFEHKIKIITEFIDIPITPALKGLGV